MLHKKQERTQAIQSEEPRIDDLKEGIPEFRNVRDRGVVQYIKYRDEIYSVVMEREGLADGVDEGVVDTSGRIDGSLTDTVGSSGVCSNATYKTQEGCEDAGATWTASSADEGWQILTGGLIIQWGYIDTGAQTGTQVFPKVFNGACFIVVAGSFMASAGEKYNIHVTAQSVSQFSWYAGSVWTGGMDINWIAIGH